MTMSELRAQVINLLQDAWELGYECGAKDVSSARPVTLDAMTDAELAEHGLVRKNKEHVVSHATLEVTPHIDWSRMADELDEFVEIVRGMAGGAE